MNRLKTARHLICHTKQKAQGNIGFTINRVLRLQHLPNGSLEWLIGHEECYFYIVPNAFSNCLASMDGNILISLLYQNKT